MTAADWEPEIDDIKAMRAENGGSAGADRRRQRPPRPGAQARGPEAARPPARRLADR